jgi:hypothetical protein
MRFIPDSCFPKVVKETKSLTQTSWKANTFDADAARPNRLAGCAEI